MAVQKFGRILIFCSLFDSCSLIGYVRRLGPMRNWVKFIIHVRIWLSVPSTVTTLCF